MTDYSDLIESAGKQYNVDPSLIRALVKVESGNNPKAKNAETGAEGLGQFIPKTAQSLGVKDVTDPTQSIPAVARLLSENLDRYGNVHDAVRAYHGGTDKANWGPKTEAHLSKVMGELSPEKNVLDAFLNEGMPLPSSQAAPASDHLNAFLTEGQSETPPVRIELSGMATPAKETATNPVIAGAGDFASALGHHLMAPLHGGANLIEQGLAAGANYLAPNSELAKYLGQTANADVAATRRLEQEYQAKTPTNIPSIAGATLGEILPLILTGGGSAIEQGGEQAANLISRLGGGSTAQALANRVGQAGAGAGVGVGYGALQPTTGEGDYFQQQAERIPQNALLGALTPAATEVVGGAANYLGNVAKAAVRPFMANGPESIANDILARATGGNLPANAINEIVEGSKPTMAEVAQNAKVSNLQRTIRDINPEPFVQRERENAQARLDLFAKASESPAELNAAIQQRDAATNAQLSNLWTNKTSVDPKPVIDKIESILSGPGGERTSVKSVLNDVKAKINNPNNTDPEYLYESVRKHIGDLLDPMAAKENRAAQQASSQLLSVRDALDSVIDKGVPKVTVNGKDVPGFSNYLNDYSAASKDIDAMKHLQGLKLTDNFGNISLTKINTAINDIEAKMKAPGVNKAKNVDIDQLDALRSIRADMQRQGEVGRGRSLGSNTAQNLVTQNMLETALPGKVGALTSMLPTGTLSGALGTGAGFALGGVPGAAAGGMIGAGIGKGWQSLMQTKNEAILDALTQKLINPETFSIAPQRQGLNLMRLANPALIGVGVNQQ